ncbi:MAG: hypothetical protein ACREPR_13530 [Brasilonema sp.]
MNYEEALIRIESSEGGKEIADAIRERVVSIDKEASAWKSKFTRAEGQISRLNALLGEEGKDAEATVKGLKEKLTKTEADLQAVTKERDAAIADREATRLSSAVKELGIDGEAFNQFLSKGILDASKVKLEGNKVLVDGKPIKEYAESQGRWMVSALYPVLDNQEEDGGDNNDEEDNTSTENKKQQQKGKVPTGGMKGGSKKRDHVKVAADALSNLYRFPSTN